MSWLVYVGASFLWYDLFDGFSCMIQQVSHIFHHSNLRTCVPGDNLLFESLVHASDIYNILTFIVSGVDNLLQYQNLRILSTYYTTIKSIPPIHPFILLRPQFIHPSPLLLPLFAYFIVLWLAHPKHTHFCLHLHLILHTYIAFNRLYSIRFPSFEQIVFVQLAFIQGASVHLHYIHVSLHSLKFPWYSLISAFFFIYRIHFILGFISFLVQHSSYGITYHFNFSSFISYYSHFRSYQRILGFICFYFHLRFILFQDPFHFVYHFTYLISISYNFRISFIAYFIALFEFTSLLFSSFHTHTPYIALFIYQL